MKFEIPITPVGQMRARACIRGRHASVYKDKKQEQAEQTLAAFLVQYRPPHPMEGPLLLYLDCHMPIPKTVGKDKRLHPHTGEPIPMKEWLTLAAKGWVRPTGKPDADNLAKHIKDVLGQVGFWDDDKQVCELVVRKWYSRRPKWVVRLEPCRVAPLGFPEDEAA
jgi:Holliday junction resolvase